jgi:hypothetical protein
MALMTVNNEEAGDFRSKPRRSAGRKMDVVLHLLRGEKLTTSATLALAPLMQCHIVRFPASIGSVTPVT